MVDKAINNLLPKIYPCHYNSSDHFVEGVLDEIRWFLVDMEELQGIERIDIENYILDNKYDELIEYFNEKCIVLKNDNLQETIRRILREEIEFDYPEDSFNYNKKENLPYHSKYEKDKKLDDYKKDFINEIKKYIVENNKIILYRVIATKSEKDIKKPFGIYWAFKKEDSRVIDWETIDDIEELKVFRMTALFNLSDINWEHSFDLYLMNDFMESELRVKEGVNPKDYFIEEI